MDRITNPRELRESAEKTLLGLATMGVRTNPTAKLLLAGSERAMAAIEEDTRDKDMRLAEIKANAIGPLMELVEFLKEEGY